jgi:hypothetical protein
MNAFKQEKKRKKGLLDGEVLEHTVPFLVDSFITGSSLNTATSAASTVDAVANTRRHIHDAPPFGPPAFQDHRHTLFHFSILKQLQYSCNRFITQGNSCHRLKDVFLR